jgi:hypothetical protein
MHEEFHPTNHIKIVISLEWIGCVWNQKRSYDRAIEYLENV